MHTVMVHLQVACACVHIVSRIVLVSFTYTCSAYMQPNELNVGEGQGQNMCLVLFDRSWGHGWLGVSK